MSAITAKASRKMKKYAVLTREPRCFLGSFDFSWEQRKLGEIGSVSMCRRIFKEQTSETGDIPFYKIGTFGAEPDAFISRELFEEYKSKYPYPQKGDILISASGSIGRTVEFAGNNEYFQDSNIVWLKHDERLSNPFLKCFYSVVKWAGIEGSTIKRLYNDNILNTVICMPSVPEQERIGVFFENLDHLITLHQRKCALLFSPFQALISMMFTTSTFSWEQRKLGDIGETYTGLSGKTKADFGHGQARFVTYMNVFSNPISNPEMTEPIEIDPKQNEVEVGDVLFTTSSETPEEVGMSSVLLEKRGKTYLNSFCFGFRPSEKIDSYYLAYMLRSESAREKIILLAQGISRYNISKNKVMEIAVSLPSLDEQKLIGQYFRQLDNLITLHQRECISFTGRAGSLILTANKKRTTSSWEQRKLGELALFNPKDELPQTFEYVDLESVVGTEMLSHRTEVKSSAPSRAQRLAHTGDLFYQTVRPYQKNNYLFEKPDNNYVFSTGYAQMRPYVDGYFLLSLVQSERFVKVVLDNCTGTSYPAINANDLAEIELAAPSDESEAQKIGTIFRSIDNLITLHQRKPFLMKWRTSDANRNQTNRLVL